MVIANTFILSFALTKWYQLSPICAADGPPFLSRKELRSARFPCVSFSVLKFYKRIFLFTPAICKDCTVPRIRSGFLPTYEPWLIPTCESSDSHRQQTKFAAFILSLQNGKRAASFPFAKLLHTCFFKREHSASRLKSQFSSLKSVFFPRHSLTQFSNLSFIHLLSSQYILHKGLSGASASPFPVYIAVHRKIESLLFFYYGVQ